MSSLPRDSNGLLIVDSHWRNVHPMTEGAYNALGNPIVGIIVCVDPAVQLPGMTRSKNHWRLFLVFQSTDDSEAHALSVDMVARSDNDKRGILGVIYRLYVVSNRAVTAFRYIVNSVSWTAEDFLDELATHAYLNYRYNPLGTGCRFWVKTVLTHLIDEGIISSPSNQADVADYMSKVYLSKKPGSESKDFTTEDVAIVPGQFYE